MVNRVSYVQVGLYSSTKPHAVIVLIVVMRKGFHGTHGRKNPPCFDSSTWSFFYQVCFYGNATYDTGVTIPYKTTPVPYIRGLCTNRATFAAHAPGGQGTEWGVLAWCRAIIEPIVEPKRSSTQGDMCLPRTHAGYSGRCRNSLHTTPVSLIHDTGGVYKPFIRHRGILATHVLDRLETITTWCRATIEAIAKQNNTQILEIISVVVDTERDRQQTVTCCILRRLRL